MERVEARTIDRLMVFAPPRHTKSLLASKMFPAWFLGQHPDRQIICASYGGKLSADFGRDVRNLVAEPEYRAIFPGTTLRADSRAADRWNTEQGGVYVASGVGGPVTGRGAHLLIIDDPIKNRKEADSESYRQDVWRWYVNDAYTRLMPGGAIVLIQTRWHEDDLAGRLLAQQELGGDKWSVLSLPAIADGDPNDPTGRAPGEALWPKWYPKARLDRIRAVLTTTDGPRAWTALYQQRPQPESGDYFRREWFRWYDPQNPPAHVRVYGASDYAVTASGGDYTVHGIIGIDPQDDIYVLDWWRQQSGSDAWVEAEIDLMKKWTPLRWAKEKGQIERGVGPFLEKRMRERRVYCDIEPFASATDKPTRAQSIRGRMSMGKVYFPIGTTWVDELTSELLRFPTGVHDDQVDVLSLFGRMLADMYRGTVPPPKPGTAFKGVGDGRLAATDAFVREQIKLLTDEHKRRNGR